MPPIPCIEGRPARSSRRFRSFFAPFGPNFRVATFPSLQSFAIFRVANLISMTNVV